MAVIDKLEQTLASLEGVSSDLKTFSFDTKDQQMKQVFSQLSEQTKNIAQTLKTRIDFVKSEEPQYREK